MRNTLLTALIALVFGFAGAGLWSLSGLGEARTRAWLVANPDILPDMAEALEAQRAGERLAQVGDTVTAPFPGAVLGNPDGTRTLVKFTDYGCTFCRTSEADVQKLIAGDPQLKIVVREWPIFDGSEQAARMALAAAEQGRYPAFYRAMFAAGRPSPATIAKAASVAGLDMDRANRVAASDKVTAELARNMELARTLGFSGTPSWVAGDQVFQGAVGFDALKQAVDDEA
ncbi:DsbA family protein [Qipengyuania sp.]|uniref:DsbA family protein n=1 Tax=Qipengyuania sp. TaxID=2004515 RepID=UPI0035C82F22